MTDIERLHPGLLAMLAAHPGIGFVVVATDQARSRSGPTGTHDLTTGAVVGEDPLALFGTDAVGDFIHVLVVRANAPDIYVNSLYDPVLDEVAAFEELVGCHGGLGRLADPAADRAPGGSGRSTRTCSTSAAGCVGPTWCTTRWCAGSSGSATGRTWHPTRRLNPVPHAGPRRPGTEPGAAPLAQAGTGSD